MKKTIIQYLIYGFIYLAILYPLWIRGQNITWDFRNLSATLFPFFGLLMVSLLWLHSLAGAFEEWLRQYINFDRFIQITAVIIFWSLILHPLLLIISMDFKISDIYAYYGATFIRLGIISWLLLISYDIGKFLKK